MGQELVTERKMFSMTVGIFACGKVREFLESCLFKGMDIEWREGRGWIDREFIVKGAAKDIATVYREIDRLGKE